MENEMANAIQTINVWAPIVSGTLGITISGLIAFFINRTNKKSEEKKHMQGLVFNAAIEEWKIRKDVAKWHADRGEEKVSFPPLEASLIYMLKVFNEILSKNLTEAETLEKLKAVSGFGRKMGDTIKIFGTVKSKGEQTI